MKLTRRDIPCEIIAGPFQTYEETLGAAFVLGKAKCLTITREKKKWFLRATKHVSSEELKEIQKARLTEG